MNDMNLPPGWDDEDEHVRTLYDMRALVRVLIWFWVVVLIFTGGMLWLIR